MAETNLEPGTYFVRVTLQNTLTVLPDEKRTESDLLEEVLDHTGSEMCDWSVTRAR